MNERILVVDDLAEFRELISITLGRDNYEVRKAASGPEALEIVRTWQPDLIILDVMMPMMDGYEVVQRLRDFEGTADVPVIMLTARSEDADVAQGYNSGTDLYLTKPFNPTELITFVQRIVG